ncbi:MAG: glycosyl transferase family 1 [Leptolyngbya foveolarum]|uniref:Glycosyl transferase family 1 n=1 Tax=Leptolyngbya foveolarum TaxID=47253 RepID=A0A2W4UMR6_9CYAN|nr:MAG: glycosyl transferase family 1 [Leptolyngbya foveolarum]
MNILMLSATFPYPPTRGGTSVRTFNLLKFLKQQSHHITLGTLIDQDVSHEEVSTLRGWVDELGVFQRPLDEVQATGAIGKMMRLANFAISGVPPSVTTTRSPAMQNWVTEKIASAQFDAITCEHSVNEVYVPENISTLIPKSVVNIHSSVYGTCAHQLANGTAENALRDRLTLPLLKRYEQRYCQKFSDLVVTTAEDRRQMSELSGKEPIHVISNGVDLDLFTMRSQDPNGQSLVFIGAMDNLPNIDAVTFLAREIFPLVLQKHPAAALSLVGARPTPAVQALSEIPNVTVTGKVSEMRPYLHESTVCVIPMRTGYGIKNKTLEAMAAGVPIVASDRGLEGLAVEGNNIPLRALRAETAAEYATAIGRLFDSAELRAQLSENGRALIERDYTWAIAGEQYEQVLTSQ